jgi:hypothetical protein
LSSVLRGFFKEILEKPKKILPPTHKETPEKRVFIGAKGSVFFPLFNPLNTV